MTLSSIVPEPPISQAIWTDPSRMFRGEEEFWDATTERFRLAEFRFAIQLLLDWPDVSFGQLSPPIRSIELLGLPPEAPEKRAEEIRDAIKRSSDREAQVRRKWKERVDATRGTEDAPRLLRVAERLALGMLEVEALAALVMIRSFGLRASRDPEPFGELSGSPRHSVLSDLLGESPSTLSELFREDGKLVRSGLVEIDRESYSIADNRIQMNPVMVRVLRGLTLQESDVAQVDEGVVLAVILEEPRIKRMREWIDPGTQSVVEEEQPSASDAQASRGKAESSEGDSETRWEDPYEDDLDYLEDQFNLIIAQVLSQKGQGDGMSVGDGPHREVFFRRSDEDAQKRNALARVRLLRARIRKRLHRTESVGGEIPVAEALSRRLRLSQFEHQVLLTVLGVHVSGRFRTLMEIGRFSGSSVRVSDLLGMFADGFKKEVRAAQCFKPDAPLLEGGWIELDSPDGRVNEATVTMSDPTADYLKGEKEKTGWLTSSAYMVDPKVDIDKVILPEADKVFAKVVATSFEATMKHWGALGLDDISRNGKGGILYLEGPSGSGKTTFAHGITKLRGRRLIHISEPKIDSGQFRAILRIARQRGADVLFDECDEILKERGYNPATASLLPHLERHDGLVMLATNRPLALDPAVDRRILARIEFRRPDAASRERIWEVHLPEAYPLAQRPDLGALAARYDLSGGEIRNAVLLALFMATARDASSPRVTVEDLEAAAARQVQGRLRRLRTAADSMPEIRLSDLILAEETRERLDQFIGSCRATGLHAPWESRSGSSRAGGSRSAVFLGPTGVGKRSAAEGVAAALGLPLRRFSAGQFIAGHMGDSADRIEELFSGEGSSGPVLLLDNGDALLSRRTEISSSTERYDITTLLTALDRYQGIVIVTTNSLEDIDPAIQRRLEWKIPFPELSAEDRARMWRRLLPVELTQDSDVDPELLARQWTLSAAEIARAVRRAAEQAALRTEGKRRVSMADLVQWAERVGEEGGARSRLGFKVG